MRVELSVIVSKFYENRMRNKVTNPFFSKLVCNSVEKIDGNTEKTRSSYDDLGRERVLRYLKI